MTQFIDKNKVNDNADGLKATLGMDLLPGMKAVGNLLPHFESTDTPST